MKSFFKKRPAERKKVPQVKKEAVFVFFMLIIAVFTAGAEEIPVKKISLFSSGVGYFEHRGQISGDSSAVLAFEPDAINDVLKSLVINDPGSTNPSVSYATEGTLYNTLRSLKIDLSGNPSVAQIFDSLRGNEIQVYAPDLVTGKIIGVEYRQAKSDDSRAKDAYLTLFTSQGIKVFALSEITAFNFTDQRITDDLNRALDLILASKDSKTRNLTVSLPGSGTRSITLGYVIPVPVWKVSYRLDLAQKTPLLQGWAIIDNEGDMDWENVELSLVTGSPVSFIQNLYPPFYVARPEVPLSIAGIAQPEVYDSGYGPSGAAGVAPAAPAPMMQMNKLSTSRVSESAMYDMAYEVAEEASLAGGTMETAAGRAAGELFEFTVKKPVTLARRQSAMIPLVETDVIAEKVSVFSGSKALAGGMINPMLCAELTNTTGMKLPRDR
ncbi:hypothetical protein K7I13_08435 [Brucepastera parasyntrophica]|uniref:hypothetical protein n=1 Tax=Brucepastera parasyntrophica TaxID=2880008 RepID=UPI00210CC303|nr:hypothetical protein [Brucepastera parasyntrophica]ULQ58596.1 hypothetical protein K7I13_08435 [Brucepastera parasyntrophica]